MNRRKAGISPVVATVILVAVAIVIAIAVAFWASGLVGVFTRFEKIEIQTAYWDGERVVVIAKNTGSSPAVVDMILVNGLPCVTATNIALPVGGSAIINVGTGANCVQQGGITNEIALHTTSGKTYPVAVLVP
ncbi:MAG: archaellin/type IV pilin N-terminal domain-containing protein [Nitrososphaerota archaeon]|nr:archaellin/type IV pilin N-terminal domain-containing protein [Nitrososphaerota archaeon]